MALTLARVVLHAPLWVVFDDTFSSMEDDTLERVIYVFAQRPHGHDDHSHRAQYARAPAAVHARAASHETQGRREREGEAPDRTNVALGMTRGARRAPEGVATIESDHFAASFDTRDRNVLDLPSRRHAVLEWRGCVREHRSRQTVHRVPGPRTLCRRRGVQRSTGPRAPHDGRVSRSRQKPRLARRSRRVRPPADGDVRDALHQRLVARRRRHEPRAAARRRGRRRHAARAGRLGVHHEWRDVLRRRPGPCLCGGAAGRSVRPPVKGVRLVNESIARAYPTVASWWNVGLFSGYDREAVVLGYLESTHSLGLVLVARTGDGEIAFLGEAVHAPPITLRPGQAIGSNRFMLSVAATPYAALEQYADAVGTVQDARTRSIVNGWCSWFYTLDKVSEDEVLLNTAFAAEHLRRFGLEYVQVDDGYQRGHRRLGRQRALPARDAVARGADQGARLQAGNLDRALRHLRAERGVPAASRVARAPPRRLAATHRQLGEREFARGARRGREALLPRRHASRRRRSGCATCSRRSVGGGATR